jgi:hypothetical protein
VLLELALSSLLWVLVSCWCQASRRMVAAGMEALRETTGELLLLEQALRAHLEGVDTGAGDGAGAGAGAGEVDAAPVVDPVRTHVDVEERKKALADCAYRPYPRSCSCAFTLPLSPTLVVNGLFLVWFGSSPPPSTPHPLQLCCWVGCVCCFGAPSCQAS